MKKEYKLLEEFFLSEEFLVHPFKQDKKQCAEVEKWTNGGVDMIITLQPFTKEKFIEYVNDFDVDDEIDNYRQDPTYKANFTITQSLEDFTDFHNMLKEVVTKLNNL